MSEINRALEGYGISLSRDQLDLMDGYLKCLGEFNAIMDLTNVPPEEWPERHIADSLIPLTGISLPRDASVADVGTGAGFPGMPIAIAFPHMHLTLLDALNKRCEFLREVTRRLRITNVEVVCGRAEEFGRLAGRRERFDVAVTRAVAKTNVLAEYMLPLLKKGGLALCWKGPKAEEEIPDGNAAACILGGSPWQKETLPGRYGERILLVSRKISQTPDQYPRRNGVPSKRPLSAPAEEQPRTH